METNCPCPSDEEAVSAEEPPEPADPLPPGVCLR